MYLLDVNVVLAAHRDDHPHHVPVRTWFDAVIAGNERFTVPHTVWASFLRLATNRRIFRTPSPLTEVFGFVEAVCGQPHHVPVGPGPRHLTILRDVCDDAAAVGDLVPDAVLAAIAIENGCEIATLDRDFARFDGVGHLLVRT